MTNHPRRAKEVEPESADSPIRKAPAISKDRASTRDPAEEIDLEAETESNVEEMWWCTHGPQGVEGKEWWGGKSTMAGGPEPRRAGGGSSRSSMNNRP